MDEHDKQSAIWRIDTVGNSPRTGYEVVVTHLPTGTQARAHDRHLDYCAEGGRIRHSLEP
jgi:hypothetical protein